MEPRTKVLYLLQSHPALERGGPETYALELYEAMRASAQFEPMLVARMGSEGDLPRRHRVGTIFSSLSGDENQNLALIEKAGFDFFYLTYGEKSLYVRYFADFLIAHQPDVVHFQQPTLMGCELISLIRRLLPTVPIVYTLHDYAPICHRDGKLVRTRTEALCLEASPRRCHECFLETPEEDFFLRKRFIQAHFNHVDRFLAPSHFLLERYVDWGIPREKIQFEDYGRPPALPVPESDEARPRTRLGYFGELSPHKGIEVLLRAMRILLDEQPDIHLWLHGANLDRYPEHEQQQFWSLLDGTRANVTFSGGYDRNSLPQLMSQIDWLVVPSRWWENSPLVIQEAFLYGRPVICSGIGGMAEKVSSGVNGLHFTVSDPRNLADNIRAAATTPGLWDELRSGIPPVYSMQEHVESLSSLYRECLGPARRAEASALSE
jgi:glycosyltransferase involved in cell wall biosynthesis